MYICCMNELLNEDILQIAEVMADLFEADDYTVGEVCAIVGITLAMYRDYYETIDEFRAIVNRGKKARQAILIKAARKSLLKLIEGYHFKTTTVKTGGRFGDTVTESEGYVCPNLGAVQLVLTKLDPDFKESDEDEVPREVTFNFTENIMTDGTEPQRIKDPQLEPGTSNERSLPQAGGED